MGYTTGSALAATCKTMVSARFPENKVPWCSSSVSADDSDFWGREETGQAARFAVLLWLSMGWSGKESAGQAQRSSASLHPSRCPGSFFLSSFWINNNDIRRFKHSPVFFTWTYGSQSFYEMLLVNGSSPCKDWGNPVMIFKAMLSWKRPIRITESKPWPCTKHPKPPTMFLSPTACLGHHQEKT